MTNSWPVYDTPQRYHDKYGDWTEIIVSGAADGARRLDEPRAFVVAEDEWDEDFNVRTIRRFAAIGPSE